MNRGHFFLVLTLCALFVSGCAPRHDGERLRSPQSGPVVRVACVGDSITFGYGLEDRVNNNYPAVLGRMLGPKFETRNFGVNGATMLKKGDKPYWQESAFRDVDAYAPDAVVIKLGTNDSKPQNWKFGDEFEHDAVAMIDHFRNLLRKPKIWLALPVPVYETQWGINEPVVKGEIIPKLKTVADEKNLPVIDLYSALQDKPEMFPDKIHPNAAGARLIARTVYAALTGNKPNE